ncbi:hypothetical protein ACFV8T_29925 [Streptomyces sp. NPDC059832]
MSWAAGLSPRSAGRSEALAGWNMCGRDDLRSAAQAVGLAKERQVVSDIR